MLVTVTARRCHGQFLMRCHWWVAMCHVRHVAHAVTVAQPCFGKFRNIARLGSLDPQVLDARPDDTTWTIREVTHHVSHVTRYADMVGRLPAG